MAEAKDFKEYTGSGEHIGRARGRKNHLSLAIKVDHLDDDKSRNSSFGGDPSSPCSSPGSGIFKERDGSLKIRKGAILHHFLHPLDYYYERKSRSSTSSINSDVGDFDGSPRCRTPEPQSKHKFYHGSSGSGIKMNAAGWPVYKPAARLRPFSSSPCPSPLIPSSPCPSPRVSPSGSPSQCMDFYNHAMNNPSSRYPDGHEANGRSRYSDGQGGIQYSKRSVPDDGRKHSDGDETKRSPRKKKSNSSSSSSSASSSRSGSTSSESSSVSDSRSLDENDDELDKKHHNGEERASRRGSHQGKVSLLSNEYKVPSSGVSPVNKLLLSVLHQEGGNGMKKLQEKSASYHGTHRDSGDIFDDTFDDGQTHHTKSQNILNCTHTGKLAEKDVKENIKRASSVERLYSVYEQIIREGQLSRRHSSADNNRTRHGSGGSFGHTYLRGEDPNQAAILFRDCRGLPAAAPFLENIRRSELEEDESQIIVKFFKYHNTYDLIPTSAKLVIFDTRLQVKKAFYALVYNGVRAAPLWDSEKQKFVGMLTITDFIRILQSFYSSSHRKMDELEEHRLEMWRTLLNDDVRNLISITPNECLYDAIRSLIHHKIHRLPVIDPFTGNVLYIITHKRILKFLFLYINELPKPSILQKSLRELNIGTYDKIETARGSTLIIEALNKFVERRISALPIVDDEGKLIDIYAKFDVINLAAEGTYHNLDVTLHQANEYRNEWFEGVLKCNLDETLGIVMERIVRAEVHRLVVVDKNNKVIGIISLSDILNELVLKPCSDDPESLKGRTVAQMEATLDRDGSQKSECSVSGEDLPRDNSQTLPLGKTESEDSVGETWSPGGGRDSEKNQDGKSSSIESMEQEKFEIDINKMPDNITKQEVLSISG